MKKLIAFVLAIALVMSLVACVTVVKTEAAEESAPATRFMHVDEDVSGLMPNTDVIVDTRTGVMYLYYRSNHLYDITPLLNTDGTPMIWEGWEK